LALFYKELKLSTFDPALAASLGFRPGLIHYLLMATVAVTTVGALGAVGAILVVALLIVPSVTGSLLTRQLPVLIFLSLLIGIAAALAGFSFAIVWNVSISGMIATMLGAFFGLAYLAAPHQGLIAQTLRRARQRQEFATRMLVVHLATHEGTETQAEESRVEHLHEGLHWASEKVRKIVDRATDRGFVARENGHLNLTEKGRSLAQEAASRD
jgi:manganese/zinc/iron transport system permease protein